MIKSPLFFRRLLGTLIDIWHSDSKWSQVKSQLNPVDADSTENRDAVGQLINDPDMAWLNLNREERMDATLSIFDKKRRDFHLARYEFASEFVKEKVVADIACGTGYGSELLAKGGASKIFAVDLENTAIRYASKYHGSGNIEYICSDACKTGIESSSCDVVVSFETIEHVENENGILDEFFRILKCDGVLICSTPNKWPLDLATYHVREYDRLSFSGLLSSLFVIDAVYNQNSGSDTPLNRGQDAGIILTTDSNEELAECYIAVCRKPGPN